MFDTRQEILNQLKAGEDSRAEFKEVRISDRSVLNPNSDDMAGELVAFTNADGGTIFLGVNDRGIVQGLPEDRLGLIEQWILNIAANNCEPPIRPIVRKEILTRPDGSDGLVIMIEIRRGLYVHQTSNGRYYIRVGSTKRYLTTAEPMRLGQQRGRTFVFDEQPVVTASSDDLNHTILEQFFGRPGIPWMDLLRNTKVVTSDENGLDRPTVAGLLSFSKNPQVHLASSYVETAVYRADRLTSDDLIHTDKIGGSVDEQIDEATSFIERFMLKPARKPGGREDCPQYDIGAVHEAIVNAVAHRDYSISGAKIRLFLFSDRLELYSPGSLPNTLTLETMPYRVFTRNQLLVSFLAKMKSRHTGRAFLESRGEGVRRILETGEAYSGRRPVYELFGDELRLTIWAKPSPHENRDDS